MRRRKAGVGRPKGGTCAEKGAEPSGEEAARHGAVVMQLFDCAVDRAGRAVQREARREHGQHQCRHVAAREHSQRDDREHLERAVQQRHGEIRIAVGPLAHALRLHHHRDDTDQHGAHDSELVIVAAAVRGGRCQACTVATSDLCVCARSLDAKVELPLAQPSQLLMQVRLRGLLVRVQHCWCANLVCCS